jgi:acyl carrier protein
MLQRPGRSGCNRESLQFEEVEYMEALIEEMKVKIIDTLSLLDVTPADIGDDDQLVGGSLGIDSIDVLELVLMLEKDYGVKIETKEVGVSAFASLRALVEFVRKNRVK